MITETRTTAGHRAKRQLPRAWWSLALFPVSFALAFVVGEGVPVLLTGTDASVTTPPWWVIAIALVSAAAIFASPLLLTLHYSNKAAAQHEPNARIPLILGAVLAGGFILSNLAGGLLVLLAG
jgi:hypothetical protein